MFLEALLKLRQICCDPRLIKSTEENPPPPSAKLDLFLNHVEEIVAEGHRILVFSQFVKMLKLMHNPLKKRNIHFLQLDGSTNNRKAAIDKFQNDSHHPVFLIFFYFFKDRFFFCCQNCIINFSLGGIHFTINNLLGFGR